MKNESVKKSLTKSKNVLEEKRKIGKANNLHQKMTNTFTIIAVNFFQEQLSKKTQIKSSIVITRSLLVPLKT